MSAHVIFEESGSYDLFGDKGATFSDCRTYRYTLWRLWDRPKPFLMVIGLNPSTADEETNDPTIKRCIDFAHAWGFGGLCMTNLFGYRATDPKDMKNFATPIGDGNNEWLQLMAREAGMVLAAWGNHGAHMGRDDEVENLLTPITSLYALKLTESGAPGHPLYIKGSTKPKMYRKKLT